MKTQDEAADLIGGLYYVNGQNGGIKKGYFKGNTKFLIS
ncbi:hypothetical protein QFZ81_002962 [Paenibacillus sp. V4I9]|nr:hypothetical protein [Paenibacillus sp. V4I9]